MAAKGRPSMGSIPTSVLVVALVSTLAALVSLSAEGPLPWNAGAGAGVTLGLIVLALLSWIAVTLRAVREGLFGIAIFTAACLRGAVPSASDDLFSASLRRFGGGPTFVVYLAFGIVMTVLWVQQRRKNAAQLPQERKDR